MPDTLFIFDVSGYASHLLGACEHVDDLLQDLTALGRKAVGLEFGPAVPADHAREEHIAATRFDAIGIAFGACPALGLQDVGERLTCFMP